MFKKALIFVCLICLLSFNVSAKSGDTFYVYGKDSNKVAEILGMSAVELRDYVEYTNIKYLAVNKDNTKQIKTTEYMDEFSKEVDSFYSLRDSEILELAKELSVTENGEIIERGKYKFLKVTARTKDSGGEYILTQYITVDNGVNLILSFHTDINEDTDYIEDYFNDQIKEPSAVFKGVATAGIIVFSVFAVFVLGLIIKDSFTNKN